MKKKLSRGTKFGTTVTKSGRGGTTLADIGSFTCHIIESELGSLDPNPNLAFMYFVEEESRPSCLDHSPRYFRDTLANSFSFFLLILIPTPRRKVELGLAFL